MVDAESLKSIMDQTDPLAVENLRILCMNSSHTILREFSLYLAKIYKKEHSFLSWLESYRLKGPNSSPRR